MGSEVTLRYLHNYLFVQPILVVYPLALQVCRLSKFLQMLVILLIADCRKRHIALIHIVLVLLVDGHGPIGEAVGNSVIILLGHEVDNVVSFRVDLDIVSLQL